jgi:DNA polymerase III epsilon subunit-like protein
MSQEEMLLRTTELLKEADAIVTKNGTRFDVAWIRTELLKHKLPPLPNVTHIDLEKAARAYFRFHSNKLEYILKYLGLGQKVKHNGFELWRKVMEGNLAAQRKMVHYCKGDLIGTEKLYKEMRPHILNHPAIRAIGTTGCPKCGSKKTKKDGFRYTACFRRRNRRVQSMKSKNSCKCGKEKKIRTKSEGLYSRYNDYFFWLGKEGVRD